MCDGLSIPPGERSRGLRPPVSASSEEKGLSWKRVWFTRDGSDWIPFATALPSRGKCQPVLCSPTCHSASSRPLPWLQLSSPQSWLPACRSSVFPHRLLFLQGTPHLSYATSVGPSMAGVLAASLRSTDPQPLRPPVIREWPCQALSPQGRHLGRALSSYESFPASRSLCCLHFRPCPHHYLPPAPRQQSYLVTGLVPYIPFSTQQPKQSV